MNVYNAKRGQEKDNTKVHRAQRKISIIQVKFLKKNKNYFKIFTYFILIVYSYTIDQMIMYVCMYSMYVCVNDIYYMYLFIRIGLGNNNTT